MRQYFWSRRDQNYHKAIFHVLAAVDSFIHLLQTPQCNLHFYHLKVRATWPRGYKTFAILVLRTPRISSAKRFIQKA